MIRTMQLVAQLANKRPCVGFRSNFEKMPNPVINHIQWKFIAGITSGCRSPAFAGSGRPAGCTEVETAGP
jgi:hypothetical protein